jgi:spermidine synthase
MGSRRRARQLQNNSHPFICQERGEISLHFGMGAVQSRMRTAEPDRLVLDYTRGMMSFLLLAPQPRHIVMLGLGGGSLVKYCHAQLPQTRFTAIEIDPEVIAMRELFAVPRDSERFAIVCADGAQWLHDHPQCCDVLLLDAFGPEGLPDALASQQFYDDAARALQPGGVVASNIWASALVRDRVIERMRAAFDSGVLTMPAEEGENTIALALRDAAMPDADALHARARELAEQHPLDLELAARRLGAALRR